MDRPNETSPRIAIIGGTLWGNRGAEAMLTTTIGRIREFSPDAKFSVFSYYPAEDRRLCNDASIEFLDCRPLNLVLKTFPFSILAWLCSLLRLPVPSRWFGKEVHSIRSADILIDIGGITFCDGREAFLPFNILTVLPAFLMQVPVVKLSQAMGPFKNLTNRLCAMSVLGRCKRVFARGSITLAHLEQTTLCPSKYKQAADVAFSYRPEFSLSDENADRVTDVCQWAKSHRDDQATLFTFVPSSLVMQKNPHYIQRLADCIENLIDDGHHVLLLPNATRQGIDKPRNNDLVAIDAIVELLSRKESDRMGNVRAVNFDVNTAGLRKMMQASDLVVTSRFHGMVAALALRIPVFVIGWSHKYEEVLADFDCPGNSIDHASNTDKLTEQLKRAFDDSPHLKTLIGSNLPCVERASLAQFEYLRQLCGQAADTNQNRVPARSAAV